MRAMTVLICFFMLILTAAPAHSHPPQDISISASGEDVDIEVAHGVSDPASHYIKTIEVRLNNNLSITQTFFIQTDGKQNARYRIPGLKKDDQVTVTAYCSKYGSLERSQKAR
mgnify:CR=1 FL=1